jgi:hypothetical protein
MDLAPRGRSGAADGGAAWRASLHGNPAIYKEFNPLVNRRMPANRLPCGGAASRPGSMFFLCSFFSRYPPPMQAPPTILGLTRWEWADAGIRFRAWTLPIIGAGGREVVPVTLIWDHPDGTRGIARCGGFVQAMDRVSEVVRDRGRGQAADA